MPPTCCSQMFCTPAFHANGPSSATIAICAQLLKKAADTKRREQNLIYVRQTLAAPERCRRAAMPKRGI